MKSFLEKSDQILSKRQKIVLTSIVITLGFILITQPVNILFKRYYLVAVLGLLAYVLTLVSLWKGMTRSKAILLFILPIFYIVFFFFFVRLVCFLTNPSFLRDGALFCVLEETKQKKKIQKKRAAGSL